MQNKEEENYLDLVSKILKYGEETQTRNSIVYRLFSNQMEFDLTETIPILTTKRVYLKGVIEELLLFLRGDTNSKNLESKKVDIWKGNTSKDFLESVGLGYLPEGEMGCAYPHQWRNFGGEHPMIPETKNTVGFDQLDFLINEIKNNPYSRRILLSAYCPNQTKYSCLPPCHVLYQFFVDKEDRLSLKMYQRSADVFLGLPFNIASCSIFLHIMAKAAGKKPHRFIWDGGDCHIYKNHLDQCLEQISRKPKSFPKMMIKKGLDCVKDIESLTFEDFIFEGYNPMPTIKAEMVS